MKRLLIFIFICLTIISIISALCEEGQIDINEASVEELDDLYGIGPVKAKAIIDSRPFESVDELINVNGIGEVTLNNIKEQGLACVDDEELGEEGKNESIEEEIEMLKEIEKEIIEERNVELDTIKLKSKDIKTDDNNENSDKTKYAKYGFVIFCTLLGFLFMLKKRKYKTEFDKEK